ncbi:MAG: excinuclease ABC subunit UvrA [Candidatus Krumholzibacteriota bacterium]|nr:excinuclease ABC subunit UvrA [Candidatus Krumholzibacteriota bacterium]
MDKIIIKGARQNNLKSINLNLPRRKVISITGVSGSGKSSLAFDTIYAEGQRRYIESISTYARQFIEKLEKPDIDSMEGISPTIAIRRKNSVKSARSTVGTSTEIYDCLRLLFARIGKIVCPDCREEVKSYSPSDVSDEVLKRFNGSRVYILMPKGNINKDTWGKNRSYLISRGFSRLFTSRGSVRIDDLDPASYEGEDLFVLIDRIKAVRENSGRIVEAVELAYREHSGLVEVVNTDNGTKLKFSSNPLCSVCGRSFEKPTPQFFSFNNPYGACPDCRGYGNRMEFSEKMIVPDPDKSIMERAVDPWARDRFEYFFMLLIEFCKRKEIPVDIPFYKLEPRHKDLIFKGKGDYPGVIPFLEKMREKSYKKGHRFFTRRYMSFTVCRTCGGTRLRQETEYVKLSGFSISDIVRMTPGEIINVINKMKFSEREKIISRDLINELISRLEFMIDVGLGYLTMDRLSRTLSGGEAQRINLANSMGANLVDSVYILDEPSVGLHASDNKRLINVMKKLKKLGNTVIVVEHDPDIIRASDYLVDLGPEPGSRGGEVLCSEYIELLKGKKYPRSKTLDYIFGNVKRIKKESKPRERNGAITLRGVSEHNLKDIEVKIPLGNLVVVSGISGSGKSSLVVDVLYNVMKNKRLSDINIGDWKLDGRIDDTVLVDQKPVGSTPRSNPVTYIKGFSYIRELFSRQDKAVRRGYEPGRFSFNKPEGRCPRCSGMGYRRVEMHFMADIFVPCEECGGKRYNRDTLEIMYKGKNISEILDLTVDEAIIFFDKIPKLGEKLWILSEVGLGYLRLGQPSNTLSGGESQRIKIARELSESKDEINLYIMDEPTTGLHMSDIENLLRVFDSLVDSGHTLVVIEHNMDVIRWADWIIDLGPGGGENGGFVTASGLPSDIMKSNKSKTGKYLKKYLGK